ncbi:uncharacterized protein LOC143018388 [Oratosquilla oratoria]|uniref:uncharacterized protein LOC143018388 n=1 Tax=Oratosquilla oratoria TaxID=337810 RepID=UPI003F763ABF
MRGLQGCACSVTLSSVPPIVQSSLNVIKALHDGAMVRVLGDGIRSDPINVCTGVRQGCVIVPVIFNLYLAAVMIAAAQGISPEDGVSLSYRLDGNLFDLRRLKAPTKTTRDCVVELQYADDVAIVGCTSDGLQRNLQELEQTYTRAGLVISTDKTEAMTTLQPNIEPATFKVYNTSIKNVPYREHIKKLERFHISCLQKILGLKWWHRIPHTEIRMRAGVDSLEAMIVRKQLRWIGHVSRMPENRLPRQILYGELAEGRRSVGGQRKRYKDCLKANLKKCGIQPMQLETLTEDRDEWKATCQSGMTSFNQNYDRVAEERRARRHRPALPGGEYVCDICGRMTSDKVERRLE